MRKMQQRLLVKEMVAIRRKREDGIPSPRPGGGESEVHCEGNVARVTLVDVT